MMKNFSIIWMFIFLCLGCNQDENDSVCGLQSIDSFDAVPSTIIPLHVDNSWTYIDSIFSIDSNDVVVDSTEIYISNLYDVSGTTLIYFSSIIPSLTIEEDTLFATSFVPDASWQNGTCLNVAYPMFFQTTDSIMVDDDPSVKYVYYSGDTITSPAGSYADNVVYTEEDILEITTHPGLGILNISMYIYNEDNERKKKRSLNLLNYELY